MGTEQSKNLWALIITPGAKYLGELKDYKDTNEDKEKVIANHGLGGLRLTLYPVYEISVNLMPQQTQEGIRLAREVGAMPVVSTLYGAPLHILDATAIQFLSDMKDGDVDGYKRLAKDAEAVCQQAILNRSNIVPGKGPRG